MDKNWLEYTKGIKKLNKAHFCSKISPKIRPLFKTLYVEGFEGESQRRGAMYKEVDENFSSKLTYKLSAEVEFSKRSIDLHGLTEEQAFVELKNFLEYCRNSNKKEAVIVTGKGRNNKAGVIKNAVPRWLEYTELKNYIHGYSNIIDSFGQSGAIRVQIKRK